MSTVNMKKAQEWACYYGIQCQLIPGASPKNCKAIIYNGITIKSSNMTGCELEALFAELACKQNVEGLSVAKQKVNEAHGRSYRECLDNFIEQYMTYADDFEGVQFKGRKLNEVLEVLVCDAPESLEYKNWLVSMQDWHGKNAKNKVMEMLNNKDVYAVNGHVISQKSFTRFITKWFKDNEIECPAEDSLKEYATRFCEYVGQ